MTLTIKKYVEGTDNEPLAGVTFKVTDGSGAPIGGGDGLFRTDETGGIVIDGLEPGTSLPTIRNLLSSAMLTIGWRECVAQKRNVKN